jgi:hypothetical protein
VPQKRLDWLALEFRVLTGQMAKSANVADRARLKKHRDAIVDEIRKILDQVNDSELVKS